MENLNRQLITKNILSLIDYSGITDQEFAHIIDKSPKTLKRIRKFESYFSMDDVIISIDFFLIPITLLNTNNLKFSEGIRLNLAKSHKNNNFYSGILNRRPSIMYAIQYYLLVNTAFQDRSFLVEDARSFFKDLGWDYSSSYISTAFSRIKEHIKIEVLPIDNGRSRNLYRFII